MSDNDSQLVQLAMSGDREAFCHLVEAHESRVRSVIASLVIDSAAVYDLAQESFLAAYRQRESYDQQQDWGAWVRGIARLQALQHNRAHRRRKNHERTAAILIEAKEQAKEQQDNLGTESHDHLQRLRQCLDKMADKKPDEYRLLEQRYFHGSPLEMIADLLQISAGNLRVQLTRARQRLRDCVHALGGGTHGA
jgi:RNA polymerase sigma-70 factor, ECF subfamily